MYPFILCFCGRSLGDLYDLFCAMKITKYAAAYEEAGIDIDPYLLPLCESIQVDLVDVFEALGLHMDCCRNHLLTQQEFKGLY